MLSSLSLDPFGSLLLLAPVGSRLAPFGTRFAPCCVHLSGTQLGPFELPLALFWLTLAAFTDPSPTLARGGTLP